MRKLHLTQDHVARVHQVIADRGPDPGREIHSDADYDAWVEHILKTHPDPTAPTQLFACGSLIWKPEFDYVSEQLATARGWHRSFCIRVMRFRGTPEQPGIMMALDRGGQCRGVMFELSPHELKGQLGKLFRREFTYKPIGNVPRWITVETASGPRPALAFIMNRASPFYTGRLAPAEIAEILARACGHWGSGAEYLLNTVTHLEAKGIRDRNLWQLQRLVAEEIERQRH